MNENIPRVIVAGLGGDSGKTLVVCGLLAECKRRGLKPIPFKKGPDYIDPAWLKLSAGRTCRNLDTFMIGREESKRIFFDNTNDGGIAIIEGNRGLFDGADAKGMHSTAELAKLLGVPVILVVDGTKVTRTLAAIVLGCQKMDSSLKIGGVILNNVSGKRHAKVAIEAIEDTTGIEVIGVIKHFKERNFLPSRYLGLVTPGEHMQALKAVESVAGIISESLNFDKFFEIANKFEDVSLPDIGHKTRPESFVRIGYFVDRAFSFYYAENLEALRDAGAELVRLSAIEDCKLDNIDGLYIGGGFPEINLKSLNRNNRMMQSVKKESERGMPIYAECGGLMYLSRRILWDGDDFKMCGIFPFTVEMNSKPQGHGYVEAIADVDNPFFGSGEKIRGHEFHYSGISKYGEGVISLLNIKRGKGAIAGRDGFIYKNTFGSYLHIHASSVRNWAPHFISMAKEFKNRFN